MADLKDVAPSIDQSVGSGTLSSQLVERIKDLIYVGKLPPGTQVTEQGLSSLFGVSRTPMREALRALESGGFVELIPNKGARIGFIDEDEYQAALRIVSTVDEILAERICSRVTDDDIADLEYLESMLTHTYEKGDKERYLKANYQIHDRLEEIADSQFLRSIRAFIAARMASRTRILIGDPAIWKRFYQDHLAMTVAIRDRNPEALLAAFRSHNQPISHIPVTGE
ncbi:GntR family transcriptional regulator [Tabrizicola sp.]|uniref:GntR family transcriptional regulator n=1 Tax=Tabrizicola sp. TaxID=2005166 RepID=UPI002FDDB4CE